MSTTSGGRFVSLGDRFPFPNENVALGVPAKLNSIAEVAEHVNSRSQQRVNLCALLTR